MFKGCGDRFKRRVDSVNREEIIKREEPDQTA